jgi:PQQ-like domain
MRLLSAPLCALLGGGILMLLAGCGISGPGKAATGSGAGSGTFSLTVSPGTLGMTAGNTSQPVSIVAMGSGGFAGTVDVTLSGLPAGIKASPASLTLTSGVPQNVTLTAAANAAAGKTTLTFNGTSGSETHAATFTLSVNALSGIDVTTYHYDNVRDGLNANETTLTLSNVNASSFGKIGFFSTDDRVDAMPLYLSGVTIAGQTHNVLYVATEHDSVYAFDADDGTQLWKVAVAPPNETASDDHGCFLVTPDIGVTATPVIDRSYGAHGAIFLVAMTEDLLTAYHQRLHALDLTTGAELSGGPTEIEASYPGNGAFSSNGVQTFEPGSYLERSALLLLNGTIYMGWASHCDQDPYTGWLMSYSEETLKQTGVLNLTPNSGGSGFGEGAGTIWMSGNGPAADANGNIYFLDANGGFDATLDANGFPFHQDYGNAFIKLSTAGGKMAIADYFNTLNTVTESNEDLDLGSGGAMLLPDLMDSHGVVQHLAVGGGKDGSIYVVDRNNMGKFSASSNNNYQQIPNVLGSGEYGSPAWFNGTIYYGGLDDVLKAFSVVDAQVQATPSSQTSESFTYPGTTPSVSANGAQNGIIWAVESAKSTGVLHAYDASSLTREIYNSTQAPGSRDTFLDNKFITPVVVNGKVYVGTPSGVAVFGLLAP